jgi:pimeloyl-ACP methyl ester carboxylesterase
MIEDPRGRIDYDEAGQGPTVVLVPGSCSTGAAWRCRRRPPPDSPALFRNGLA